MQTERKAKQIQFFLFYLKRKRGGKRIFVSGCSMMNIKLQRFFALTIIKQRNAVMLIRLPDVALRGNQTQKASHAFF